jgi:hypothetical protein
LYVFQK